MLRALVLGAVQGLTEFIPVSSSGHLILVPYVLGWSDNLGTDVAFQVAIHLGTLVALFAYFHRELWAVVLGAIRTATGRADHDDRAATRLMAMLGVGTIPAVLVGLTLKDPLERTFEDIPWNGVLLASNAVLLVTADVVYRRRPQGRREVDEVRWIDALLIGSFQALAILPAISRSGATIFAGVAGGLSREAAGRFSFLLAVPAIIGAAVLLLPDLEPGTPIAWVVGAALVAAITSLAAIAFLLRYLRSRPLGPFAVYCVLGAALVLLIWAVR
jgi:undecaprenyl-diphosphatase